MKVLSHRGYWKTPDEKNQPVAFARSFEMSFGTETDLRDLAGMLVISHDPPEDGAMPAADMAMLHRDINPALTLALNIKADGLQTMTRALLDQFAVSDAFVFDMSVPDAIQWVKEGVPIFARHSDVEPEPALYAEAAGVWLDAFRSDWWDIDVVARHLDTGKRVCIVSPELHGRDHRPVWNSLAGTEICRHKNVLICTDYPEEAKECLNED